MLVVQAKMDDSREEPGLLLDEVWTLGEALEHFRGGLSVQLEPGDEGHLDALAGLLESHKGGAPCS